MQNNYDVDDISHIISRNKRFKDLTGLTFGRLSVIGYIINCELTVGNTNGRWVCKCICGNTVKVRSISLRNGDTQSCGCIHKETTSKINYKHGETKKTLEYTAWAQMKQRCYDVNSKNYPDYGGRGIIVCKEWIDDYTVFLKDMGRKPSSKHSLDRIDVNGNYSKENCRWATRKQQNRNQRKTLIVSYIGKDYALRDICEILDINVGYIRNRIYRNKIPIQLIFDAYLQTRPNNLIIKN